MKKQILSLGILTAVFSVFAVGLPALAQGTNTFGTNYLTGIGLSTTDVRTTIVSLINTALGILGVVVLVIIIAGGFRWMTAAGDDDAIGAAKKIISSGIIGLIIIMIAYAITNWLFDVLLSDLVV